MVNHKIKTYIGFSVRANQIVWGSDQVLNSKKRLYLILMTQTINKTAYKKLINKSNVANIPIVILTDEDMKDTLNKDNCKCVGLTNEELAKAIIKENKGAFDE